MVRIQDGITRSDKVLQASSQVIEGADDLISLHKASVRVGDEFYDVFADVAVAAGKDGASGVSKVVLNIDDAALASLKASGNFSETMVALGKTLSRNVDPKDMVRVLNNKL
jgi:hypothetical protein